MALPAGKSHPKDLHDQMANLDTGEFINHAGETLNIRRGHRSNIGAHTTLVKAGHPVDKAYLHKMHNTAVHKHLDRHTKNPHPDKIARKMHALVQKGGGMLPMGMGMAMAQPLSGGGPQLPAGGPMMGA